MLLVCVSPTTSASYIGYKLEPNSPPIQAVVAITCPLYCAITFFNSDFSVGTRSIFLSV